MQDYTWLESVELFKAARALWTYWRTFGENWGLNALDSHHVRDLCMDMSRGDVFNAHINYGDSLFF